MSLYIYLIYLLFIFPIGTAFAYFTERFQSISKFTAVIEVILAFLILLAPFRTYSYFDINQVNRVLIISVAIVYAMAIFYASMYHGHMKGESKLGLHYSLMHLFTFTMLFSLLINNFGLMWIGIEATTASSALLLIIERERSQIEAAWRYALIVSSGLTLAILSIILLYLNYHTLTVTTIISMGHQPSVLLGIAGVTALIGFGTKIGIFPMHTWLPDAHGEAPSEISAMFSGILLPVAAYVLYRFYEATNSPRVTEIFIIFCLASIVFVALVMPSQRNIKRMFAYSTMENMALITLGLITGGLALVGALLIILTHAFAKSAAFFSSGNILKTYGTKDMEKIDGLRDRMPLTAGTLVGSSLMVTGAPPFAIFVGEFFILYQLFLIGNTVAVVIIAICLFIISLSVMHKVSSMVFNGNDMVKGTIKLNLTQGLVTLSSLLLAFGVIFVYLGGYL